jgi:V8-like Glu-specific endopeptidase
MRGLFACALIAALIAALIVALAPLGAKAGDTAARRMLRAHEQLEWRGIGRLNFEGGGYCTATLVSETLVITAAHCLFDDTRRRRNTDLWFAAGFRNGRWEAIRQARRTAVHPDYVPSVGGRAKPAQVASDIALIELDAPVLGAAIPHYRAGDLPGEDGAVALLSYGRGRDQGLSMQEPCRVTGRWGAIVRLTCEVAPGSSGSPVFRRGAGGAPTMVAVISGYDAKATFAVSLDVALAPLRAALEGQGPRRKTVDGGGATTARTGGGAPMARTGGDAPTARTGGDATTARSGGGVRRASPDGAGASTGPRLQGGGAWKPKRPPGG